LLHYIQEDAFPIAAGASTHDRFFVFGIRNQTITHYFGGDSYRLRYKGNKKTIQAPTIAKVEQALATFIVEVDKNKFKPPAKTSVKDFIEKRWLTNP
jgi:hypothetical protein